MKLNELEVLQLLKDKLIIAAKVKGIELTDSAFGSLRWGKSEKRVFYLYDYRNNLYETPSSKTELGTGIEAVCSSAAMIFNLFGEKEFVLDRKLYTGIEYEKTFPSIEGRPPAHLDVVFNSKDNSELYAVEAKMLEWKDSPKNLAKAYLDEEVYYPSNKNSQSFIEFFQSLINQEQDEYGRYKHFTKRYDAIQMTIHTLSLYNFFSKETSSAIKKLTLLNVVWKYDCDEYSIEEKEAYNYMKAANARFAPLFKQIGIVFSIQYSTLQDFKKRIDFSNAAERFEYLKRYE